jgi:hypothetical protein
MRRSLLLAVAAAVAAFSANAATPAHKRLPSPAGTPSPLNAYRDRPTVLRPTPSRGATVPAYAVNLDPINGNTFVFLDAANPGELTVIARRRERSPAVHLSATISPGSMQSIPKRPSWSGSTRPMAARRSSARRASVASARRGPASGPIRTPAFSTERRPTLRATVPLRRSTRSTRIPDSHRSSARSERDVSPISPLGKTPSRVDAAASDSSSRSTRSRTRLSAPAVRLARSASMPSTPPCSISTAPTGCSTLQRSTT